jgi:hypothetical protein
MGKVTDMEEEGEEEDETQTKAWQHHLVGLLAVQTGNEGASQNSISSDLLICMY